MATCAATTCRAVLLNELNSDKDYTQRDAQFVRIAGPLERLFPLQWWTP